MVIVFNNHHGEKEGMAFWLAVSFLFVFVFVVSAIAFSSNPREAFSASYSGNLVAKINFIILDSQEVRDLKPFPWKVEKEFAYTAKNKFGKKVKGTVLAANRQEAENALLGLGLKNFDLQEESIGTNNPFAIK